MEVRDNGSIRIRFAYKGVNCRETLKNLPANKKNIAYAEALAQQIRAEITLGTFEYSQHFPQSKMGRRLSGAPSHATLDDIADEYEAYITAKHPKATVTTYMQPLNSWWLKRMNLPLALVDAQEVRQQLKAMHREELAHKTIQVYKTAINRFLDYAVDEALIPENPALSVSVGRVIGSQKGAKSSVDPFTQDEVKTLLEGCSGFLRRHLAFAFYTGMRPSEIYALRWSDVSIPRGSVYVCRACVHGAVKGMTKTDAGRRDIQLLPQALTAIKEQQKKTRFREHGFVWENPITHKPLRNYKEIAGRWKRLLDKCEVRYRNPYQTRHTYASHLLSGGENLWFVSQQMGHANTEITQRHYARWIRQAESYEWRSEWGQE